MGLSFSIFLFAVGAILRYAVNASVQGIELTTVGMILMVVGAVGFVASLAFWSSWGGFGGEGTVINRRHTTVVEDPRDPRL